MRGIHGFDVGNADFIVALHSDLRAQFAEILHEIESE
jgi:hypothetical protein